MPYAERAAADRGGGAGVGEETGFVHALPCGPTCVSRSRTLLIPRSTTGGRGSLEIDGEEGRYGMRNAIIH